MRILFGIISILGLIFVTYIFTKGEFINRKKSKEGKLEKVTRVYVGSIIIFFILLWLIFG